MTSTSYGIEYTKVAELKGPLMIIDGVTKVSFDELVEIETVDGEHRLGRVLEVGFGKAIVQVFEGTTGLTIKAQKRNLLARLWKCQFHRNYWEEYLMVLENQTTASLIQLQTSSSMSTANL